MHSSIAAPGRANVRDQLTRAGGEMLFTSARHTAAWIAKAGQETWVQVSTCRSTSIARL